MLTKSPSGALSPYYYKGGSFHGMHYGSFAGDREGLLRMMAAEEEFVLRSPQSRRIMIDLFETDLTPEVLAEFAAHIQRLRPRIVKLGISAERKHLKKIRKALLVGSSLGEGQLYMAQDMEETKTWLVA